eukprot:2575003-Rhodomonas_salina.4
MQVESVVCFRRRRRQLHSQDVVQFDAGGGHSVVSPGHKIGFGGGMPPGFYQLSQHLVDGGIGGRHVKMRENQAGEDRHEQLLPWTGDVEQPQCACRIVCCIRTPLLRTNRQAQGMYCTDAMFLHSPAFAGL